MRVLVGSVGHESNTFTPLPTKWEDFWVTRGDAVLEATRGSLGGIIATLRQRDLELVPTINAHALPGGVVERAAFEALRDGLVAGASGVDAVCLFLHGAMRAEGEDYGDTALLMAVRRAVGPDVPISVALDMHGNITADMVAAADALVTYRTAPHIDTRETGIRAAELLLWMLDTGKRPAMGYVKVPILMPGEMAQTAHEPMKSFMRLLAETDRKPHLLSSTIAKVHCWGDVPDQGVAAVAVTDGDAALAQAEAERLALAVWQRRGEFRSTVETYPVDEAIDVAMAAPQESVFLSDSGDNPGAGGTTDVVYMIERLLAKNAAPAAIAAIWDPEAVAACVAAGVGSTVRLAIGGKVDTWHGRPLTVEGRVRTLSDGEWYDEGVRRPENRSQLGRLAVLSVQGVDIMLSERRISIYDPEQMRIVGLEPLAYKIVVIKRGYLEPLFQAIAPRAILALSPGATNCDLTQLPYRRVRRPIYPLDPDMAWGL
ncbi:MAG: M81 family metallopeptidase [Anaerolineae bacterium]